MAENVVETIAAAPKIGWNKTVEKNNIVDPDSRNLPDPRTRAASAPVPEFTVSGTDDPPQNQENTAKAPNGHVAQPVG